MAKVTKIKWHPKGEEALKNKIGKAIGDVVEYGFQVSQDRAAETEDTGALIESGIKVIEPRELNFWYGYTAPHAVFVEFGTDPHWPPPVPIYEWCRRRLQKTGRRLDDTNGNAEYLFLLLSGKVRKRLSEAEKTFKGVYRHIGMNGTEPHPYMRPSLEAMIAEGNEILKRGLST